MKPKPANLVQIQRWMQSVVMHPGGVAEGVDSAQARAHLDVPRDELPSVITRSRALDSAQRLEIYVDAYYERLLECLREEFPATRFAVGDELFHALAFGYLQHYPSHSYTLNALGHSFSRYLAESRLHERDMPSDAPESWADFVIELAQLERTLRDVFDGPGIERLTPLTAEAFSRIPPERWGEARLVPAPCLRVVHLAHPLHEYWRAVKDGQRPAAPAPRATWLAIHRRHWSVRLIELTPLQFRLLSALLRGSGGSAPRPTLGEALLAAAATSPEAPGELERSLHAWFQEWTGEGFFAGVSVESP